MSVALIADAHLGGAGGEPAPFLEQLVALPAAGCRHLILVGDLFHVWVGAKGFETSEVRAVVAALRRLRKDGLRIDYVEGNRDFFLVGSHYSDCFDRLGAEVTFEFDGHRYLVVHGDGLNDRDRQYLFWRRLSKGPATRLLARWLPTAWTRRLMLSMEARLAQTNFRHRTEIPETAILSYGQRRIAEGYDALYLGHFHESRCWRVEGGEIRLLDAWFHGGHVEWLGS